MQVQSFSTLSYLRGPKRILWRVHGNLGLTLWGFTLVDKISENSAFLARSRIPNIISPSYNKQDVQKFALRNLPSLTYGYHVQHIR